MIAEAADVALGTSRHPGDVQTQRAVITTAAATFYR